MAPDVSRLLNALGLLAIGVVLLGALVDQLWFGELPCPLCLLQRAGFIAAGFGLALNLIFGPKPSHYGITILGAVAGGAVALRQIVLHIVPGTGSYGDAVLGMHLYSWAFTIFALIVVGCAVMLLFDRQFARPEPLSTRLKMLPLLALSLFTLLTAGEMILTAALCGAGVCPDSPDHYQLIREYLAPNAAN
ncbi:MAG: disulfide bond formation protein B [Methyloceanibacter sp.]